MAKEGGTGFVLRFDLPGRAGLPLVHQAQHHARENGVELRAHAVFQFRADRFFIQRVAVTANGSHGVVGICHRDDARDLGNILARQTVGVAAAVVALW